ncbi:hypothetical protein M9458_021706, partial [Cirrhinus mrigala]
MDLESRTCLVGLVYKHVLFHSIGGARSNAHNLWGLPPDTHSPRAVQSSMPEARATGTLPVEEVGSSLFPSRPLKSRSKFNLTQFVKGGSVSSQSTSHAQTAPSSSVSAALLLPVAAQPSSSLTSSGSTFQGAASGVSSQTQYAASGSGPVVSTQGESSSYPAKLVVSGQSTSDSLPVSSSLESSGLQSAGASLSVFSQESISQSSSSAPGAVSISQSSPVLLESMGQPVSSQGEGSSSGLSQGASSQYTPDSNAKLSSSTFSSQSTGDQSSPSLGSSSQGSSGMFLVSGSSLLAEATGLGPLDSSKSPETSSQLLPMPLISSQSTSSQSSPSLLTVVPQSSSESKLTDAASSLYIACIARLAALGLNCLQILSTLSLHNASSLYTPVSLVSNKLDALPLEVSSHVSVSSTHSSLSLSPGTLSAPMSAPQAIYSQTTGSGSSYGAVSRFGSLSQTGASGQFTSQGGNYYLKPISSPQSTSSQATSVLSSRKQYTTASQGSSGAQFGASQGLSSSYSGSVLSQGTTSQFAPGADSLSTTVQSSRKQFVSSYGTQSGSSAPFTLQGSLAYAGSPQAQGTASQLVPGYASGSLSSPQTVAGPTAAQSSQKQFTSTFTDSSGTQAGSSTLFTLQGSTAYSGSPQPQGTTSQFAPGSQPSYAGVSLSSPQAVAGPTIQSSRKQFTSASQGSSGAQFGASTGFASQGMSSSYSGSVQSQGTASQFAPGYAGVSLSSPQAGPSTNVLGSQKLPTSTYMGSSGTQAGAALLMVDHSLKIPQVSLALGHLPHMQVYHCPHPKLLGLLLVLHQKAQVAVTVVLSSLKVLQVGLLLDMQVDHCPHPKLLLKQFTSTFTGSSGTQAGSSTRFSMQGSTAYGSPPSQGTTSQFAPGSQSSYAGVLLLGHLLALHQEYRNLGPLLVLHQEYCNVPLSPPQAVAGPTTAQSSWKQFTPASQGSSRAQFGASTGFASQGMSSFYSGSVQSQGTTSQFAPGSPSYAGVSLSSPQAGPSAAVQGSLKRPTSTYMGSSGTQAGSSTLLALQGSTTYGASQPQGTTSQFAPGSSPYASVSLSSPQGVAGSTAVQSSRKQLASTFTGSSGAQFGASTGFASGVSSRYSGSVQSQGTASQFAPGSPSYAGVSLSSPQAGPSAAVQGSLKRPTSTYMGSSGTQAGSSTLLALQGSTTYGGSQPQGTTSQFAPGVHGSSLPLPLRAALGLSLGHLLALHQKEYCNSLPSEAALAPRQGPPLSSPYREALLMVGHLSLKMLLVSLPLDLSPPMKVHHCPHLKVISKLFCVPKPEVSKMAAFSHSLDTKCSDLRCCCITGLFISKLSNTVIFWSFWWWCQLCLSTKYTPGSQLYDPNVASQGTSSASAAEFLSGYSSMYNQNAPAQPSHSSSSSRFYSGKL